MRKVNNYVGAFVASLFTIVTSIWALNQSNLDDLQHYWLSAWAVSTYVSLPGSVSFGLAAAIRGANNREALALFRSSPRSLFRVTFHELGVLFFCYVATYFLILAILAPMVHGANDRVSVFVSLIVPSLAFSQLLFSYFIGLVAPRTLALSVGTIAPLVFSGLSVSAAFFPLHFTTGLLYVNCCRIYTQLDQNAVMFTIATNVLISIGILALLHLVMRPAVRNIRKVLIAVGVTVLLEVLVICSVGLQLGPTPLINRGTGELICQGREPIICLYPQQSNSSKITSRIREAWAAIKEIYPHLPNKIVGRQGTIDAIGVVVTVNSKPVEVAYSVAADSIGSLAYCKDSEHDEQIRNETYRLLQNLFLTVIENRFGEFQDWRLPLSNSEEMKFAKVRGLSLEAKRDWTSRSMEVIANCDIKPSAN